MKKQTTQHRSIFSGLNNQFSDGRTIWLNEEDTLRLLQRIERSRRFIKEIRCMPALDSPVRKPKHFGSEPYQPNIYNRWYYEAFSRLKGKGDNLLYSITLCNIHDYFQSDIFSDCKDHFFYNLN